MVGYGKRNWKALPVVRLNCGDNMKATVLGRGARLNNANYPNASFSVSSTPIILKENIPPFDVPLLPLLYGAALLDEVPKLEDFMLVGGLVWVKSDGFFPEELRLECVTTKIQRLYWPAPVGLQGVLLFFIARNVSFPGAT